MVCRAGLARGSINPFEGEPDVTIAAGTHTLYRESGAFMRKQVLISLLGAAALVLAVVLSAPAGQNPTVPKPTTITVYKTATCGCCGKWVEHMTNAGFAPIVKDLPEVGSTKAKLGVPADLQSCHTTVVDGYVVEGHVPADVVRQLLKERPKVTGIAVPGMPMGSPGMEQGDQKDPYAIIAFDEAGKTTVYAKR
jgi:hypothetical protein